MTVSPKILHPDFHPQLAVSQAEAEGSELIWETFPATTTVENTKPSKCKSYTDKNCSCILYIQSRGIPISGDAKDLVPNWKGEVYKGDIALFYFPTTNIYHAALVEEVYIGAFLVSEANFVEGEITERVIRKDDPFLRGFIHRNGQN